MKKVGLRKAVASELNWVNCQYEEIGFLHSNLESDFTVVAEKFGEKIGLGRLVYLNETQGELGGIYVLPKFRKQGFAEQIVNYLLGNSKYKTLYCLPFSHLEDFYTKLGFRRPTEIESADAPVEVTEKLYWCGHQYPKLKTILLIKS